MCGPMEDPHGGDELPRRDRVRDSPGDAAGPPPGGAGLRQRRRPARRRGDRVRQVERAARPGEPHDRCVGRWSILMAEMSYRDAIAYGIAQEMRRDPRLVMLGEDIAAAGGVFKTTVGLLEQFGP